MGESSQKVIPKFSKRYSFLSNFAPSKIIDPDFGDIVYETAEHAYQAMKFREKDMRMLIAKESTPGRAKRLGRRSKPRADWDDVKIRTMRWVLKEKFSDPYLKERLLDTGTAVLEEGNKFHDVFWGICRCKDCPKGKNWLGKLLMELRSDLKNNNKPVVTESKKS